MGFEQLDDGIDWIFASEVLESERGSEPVEGKSKVMAYLDELAVGIPHVAGAAPNYCDSSVVRQERSRGTENYFRSDSQLAGTLPAGPGAP